MAVRFEARNDLGSAPIISVGIPDWLLELLPPDVVENYRLNDIFVGGFAGGARWALHTTGVWLFGQTLADGWFDSMTGPYVFETYYPTA